MTDGRGHPEPRTNSCRCTATASPRSATSTTPSAPSGARAAASMASSTPSSRRPHGSSASGACGPCGNWRPGRPTRPGPPRTPAGPPPRSSPRTRTTCRSPCSTCWTATGGGRRWPGWPGWDRDTPASPAAVDLDDAGRPVAVPPGGRDGQGASRSTTCPVGSGRCPAGRGPSRRSGPSSCPMARPGQAQLAGFVVAGVSPRLRLRRRLPGVPRPAGRARRRRRRQRTGLRGGAAAGRGPGRAGPGQDRLLLQRQPRVPHPADAHARPGRGHAGPQPTASCRPPSAGQLEVVNRNGLRLLRLVNTLLDFSRIEAGRVRADLRADRPRRLHRRPGQRLPLRRASGPGCGWWSTARRWPSRSSWTGRCGRRSS